MRKTTPWTPEGFEDYTRFFPETPALPIEENRILNADFIETWNLTTPVLEKELSYRSSRVTLVLARGFLGGFMPGNMAQTRRKLRDLGFDAFIAGTCTNSTVRKNSVRIQKELQNSEKRNQLLFLGHSRGGLESLLALKDNRELRNRCAGVIMSQTAYGPSWIVDRLYFGKGPIRNRSRREMIEDHLQALGLRLIGARRGARELSSHQWPTLIDEVDSLEWSFPLLQCASWSTTPTTWLDSWHGQLEKMQPGRAHDGQFYLDDLIWPRIAHVLLPQIDHAQPAMGGHGFDPVRYWLTLLYMVLSRQNGAP